MRTGYLAPCPSLSDFIVQLEYKHGNLPSLTPISFRLRSPQLTFVLTTVQNHGKFYSHFKKYKKETHAKK